MPGTTRRDRRHAKAQGFNLGPSGTFQIPPRVAVPLLAAIAGLVGLADAFLDHRIWLGPVYLLICACAAWSVGARFAILLGLAVIVLNATLGRPLLALGAHSTVYFNFITRVICVTAIAIMLGQARRLLDREWHLARTDNLTGALNRQAFFEIVRGDCTRPSPSLLVFADVDGLKRLNDEAGHEHGDKALVDFAARVRGAIRTNDLFARIGGDEFLLLMKVRDERAANRLARRLDTALNRDCASECGKLRASLGALFLPSGSTSIDLELNLADQLMYAAKKTRAGCLVARTVLHDGQFTLFPPLDGASPPNRKTVVRLKGRQGGPIAKSSPPADAPEAKLAL